MSHHRKIVILLFCAVLIVWLAAAMRIYGLSLSSFRPKGFVPASAIIRSGFSGPDNSFFQSGDQKTLDNSAVQSDVLNPVHSSVKTITAKAYLVGDVDTGKVYIEKRSNDVLPVASMSKLVTALVVDDSFKSVTNIVITAEEASTSPDASNLRAGEQFTAKELLYPLLMNSSNVAAEALASSTNRPQFLELMSGYAWEVGMPSTFFADPSGLSPQNRASARDLFAFAQYMYKSRQDILSITRIPFMTVATTTEHGSHLFTNIHPFVNDSRFLGGKTGHTDQAGDTMLTILQIGNRKMVFIVLGSGNGERASDTRMLIDRVATL